MVNRPVPTKTQLGDPGSRPKNQHNGDIDLFRPFWCPPSCGWAAFLCGDPQGHSHFRYLVGHVPVDRPQCPRAALSYRITTIAVPTTKATTAPTSVPATTRELAADGQAHGGRRRGLEGHWRRDFYGLNCRCSGLRAQFCLVLTLHRHKV